MEEVGEVTELREADASADPEDVLAQLDDRIGVLAAQIHALSAELVDTVGAFDDERGWQDGGYRSMAQWLSVRTKFTHADAQKLVSVVQQRDELPTLMDAARSGRVSIGVAAMAARVSTPENEQRVAGVALACTPSQAARVLSTYRDLAASASPADEVDEVDDQTSPEPEPTTWWRSWYDDRGRGRLDAAVDGLTMALLQQAWDAARAAGEAEVPAEHEADDDLDRRADVNEIAQRLASTMLDHANDEGLRAPGGERFGVLVTIDAETLARVLGLDWDSSLPTRLGSECFDMRSGRHLCDREVARILCDAKVQVLVHHQGAPLWLSNETRTANRPQRRALRFRSGGTGGCEYPGCTQTRYVDAHHIAHHACGGCTDPENLLLLCSWHHRRLHDQHWRLESHDGQTVTFWDRFGTCLGSTTTRGRPPGRAPELERLPFVGNVPDPPPDIDTDTPKSETRGERMTPYAMDAYLMNLLAA